MISATIATSSDIKRPFPILMKNCGKMVASMVITTAIPAVIPNAVTTVDTSYFVKKYVSTRPIPVAMTKKAMVLTKGLVERWVTIEPPSVNTKYAIITAIG